MVTGRAVWARKPGRSTRPVGIGTIEIAGENLVEAADVAVLYRTDIVAVQRVQDFQV
jgi:hypothetical protein